MPSVDVVVPFRGGCKHRERAWQWVQAQYAAQHPDWTVIEAPAPSGAWCKALAILPAVRASTAETLVVADADVWTTGLSEAVQAVCGGRRWALPHFNVHRLTQDATRDLIAGGDDRETVQLPYRGFEGGGITVIRRDAALVVPMDPRFRGWGGEDDSWGYALAHFYGRPWRGTAPLLHLWHPPQPRMTRRYGSLESKRLSRRYAGARMSRQRMTELIQEVHKCLSQPSLVADAR